MTLSLFVLAACDGGGKSPDDTGNPNDDSGPTDDTGGHTYDPGCIQIDGAGGYANLQDAITVAPAGGVVTLCPGTYTGSVVIDKTVTIQGDTREGVILQGEGTSPALDIVADLVTVSTLTVTSTYSGVVVDGADGVTLTDLTYDQPGYWGLQLKDALNTVVSDSSFLQPGGGGIQITGGTATISGVQMDNPTAFGLDIRDNANVTLTGSTITGALTTTDDVTDGHGINLADSSLTTDGNVIQGVDGIGIYASTSALTLRDDTISNPIYLGIYAFDAAYDVEGVTITDAYLQGAYLVGPSIRWVDNVVTAQSKLTCSLTYDDWGQNGDPWCGGALLGGDVVTVEGGDITGYNNYGMYIGGYTDNGKPVTVTNLAIHDVGRWGLYLYDMESTVSGLSVTGMYEPEMAQPCQDDTYIYLDRSVSLLVVGGTASVDASSLTDNGAWGVSNVQGRVTIAGSTFDAQACSSILNYQGAATVTGNTFSGGQQNGHVWDYEAATVVDGNTFVDNHYLYSYEYDSGGTTYGYNYTGYSIDIYGYTSSSLQVTNNVFTDGDQGIVTYYGAAEVTGNTWDDYGGSGGALFYAYQPSGSSPPLFADNTIGTFGGYMVLAYYGDVEIEDVTVENHGSVTVEYENYTNGELTSSGSYTSSSSLMYAYGNSTYPTSLSVDGLTVMVEGQSLLSSYDSSLDLQDIWVDQVGGTYAYAALSHTWSSVAPNYNLEGLTIGTGTGAGVTLSNSYSGAANVTMSGLAFGQVTGTGVQLSSIDGFTIADSALEDVGTYGIYSSAPVTGTGTAVIDGVSVAGASNCGIYLVRGAVQVGETSSTASSSGLCLYSMTAEVTNSSFTENTNYGMECSTVNLSACHSNYLDGNGVGQHSGCDDACGVAP